MLQTASWHRKAFGSLTCIRLLSEAVVRENDGFADFLAFERSTPLSDHPPSKVELIDLLTWCLEGVQILRPMTRNKSFDLFVWDSLAASVNVVAVAFLSSDIEDTGNADIMIFGDAPESREEALARVEEFLDKCLWLMTNDQPIDKGTIYVRAETYAILLRLEED